MALYEDYSDEIIGEGPCEFCGDLYPLVILIEHETACRPDLAHYNFADDFGAANQTTTTNFVDDFGAVNQTTTTNFAGTSLNDVIVRQFEGANIEFGNKGGNEPLVSVEETKMPPVIKNEPKKITEVAQVKKMDINNDIKQAFEKFQKSNSSRDAENKVQYKKIQAQQIVALEERGDTSFGTGSDLDYFENEKQASKIPNNPLMECVNQKDDVEDMNNLTDDDCDESLEEFWKRARDFLKRRRRENV